MTDQQVSPTIGSASFKNGLILALFAFVSTGLIAITNLITKDKIAQEIEAAMARRLNEIVPANQYDNDVYHDCTLVNSVELLGANNLKVYRMRKQGNNFALFMTSVAPEGYGGKIKLVLGIYQDGTIAGARVVEHKETPGLGDKIEIEKSDWIRQFDGKSLENLTNEDWHVKKDGGQFDAMTGATITPRAIIKAIHNTLIYYAQNEDHLFSQATSCQEN